MKKHAIWLNAIPVFAICYVVRHGEAWGVPGIVSATSYLLGITYGVLGILKIKKYTDIQDKDKNENLQHFKDAMILSFFGFVLFVAPILLY